MAVGLGADYSGTRCSTSTRGWLNPAEHTNNGALVTPHWFPLSDLQLQTAQGGAFGSTFFGPRNQAHLVASLVVRTNCTGGLPTLLVDQPVKPIFASAKIRHGGSAVCGPDKLHRALAQRWARQTLSVWSGLSRCPAPNARMGHRVVEPTQRHNFCW